MSKKKKKINKKKLTSENKGSSKFSLFVSAITLFLLVAQTIYFSKQTEFIKQQTDIQKKSLEEFIKETERNVISDRKRYEFEINSKSSFLSVDNPEIKINKKINEYELDVNIVNKGENPISKFHIEILFISTLKVFSKAENKEINYMLPVSLNKIFRSNGVIIFPSEKYFRSVLSYGVISHNLTTDENIHTIFPLKIKSGEKINQNQKLYFGIRVKFQDKFTSIWKEVYSFYQLENDITVSPPIAIDEDYEMMKSTFINYENEIQAGISFDQNGNVIIERKGDKDYRIGR